MQYTSTRDEDLRLSAHKAILRGLSAEGGLFLPTRFPEPFCMKDLYGLDYEQIAVKVLAPFLSDYSEAELQECVHLAYSGRFSSTDTVPVHILGDHSYMELMHGPTCAFKDIALTLLPHLLTRAYEKEGLNKTISILTATSGDTGKAALSGFCDVPQTAVTVFYPMDGVAKIQQLQMTTSPGQNVCVIAVEGNFDDCQRMVKEACMNKDVQNANDNVVLSSANSINIGRLLPQVVYYFTTYLKLLQKGTIQDGEKVSFVVPTGNFGDILAGWIAKQIGLPVKRLICASNQNKVLTDFLNTGTYSIHRPFHTTISPSMDILISSNLERLLYFLSNDSSFVRTMMQQLQKKGEYTIPLDLLKRMQKDFAAFYAEEDDTKTMIRTCYEKEQVLLDPHTAVAASALAQYRRTGAKEHCVLLSTASPFKFPRAVLSALGQDVPDDDFEAMRRLSSLTGQDAPAQLAVTEHLPIRFTRVIRPEEGLQVITKRLQEIGHD